MTKPKRWNGPQKQKPTGKRRPPAPTTLKPPSSRSTAAAYAPLPLEKPAEPIPDEIEVLDEQTTLGDST